MRPARDVLCIAGVALALGASVAHASLTYGGPPGEADKLTAILGNCIEMSPAFARLYREATNDPLPYHITLVRSDPSVLGDRFGFGGDFGIDMADLEATPHVTRDPTTGELAFPPGMPAWAPTRCESLAHTLGEMMYAATTNENYDRSHEVAIFTQNQIRRDLGQEGVVLHQTSTWQGTERFGIISIAPPPGRMQIWQITDGNITGIIWAP